MHVSPCRLSWTNHEGRNTVLSRHGIHVSVRVPAVHKLRFSPQSRAVGGFWTSLCLGRRPALSTRKTAFENPDLGLYGPLRTPGSGRSFGARATMETQSGAGPERMDRLAPRRYSSRKHLNTSGTTVIRCRRFKRPQWIIVLAAKPTLPGFSEAIWSHKESNEAMRRRMEPT